MDSSRLRPSRWVWIFLVSIAAFLVCPAAHAVSITDFITVQPIDVCSGAAGTTTGCAPINNLGQNYATAAVGNIGAIDVTSTGNINVTRAIWNRIGVDVTFLPAVQDSNAGSFLTLPVTSCAANGTDCQSPQFQTLSDQAAISMGQTPTPVPPLSQNPATINIFSVNSLSPPADQPGTLYGLGWINNNGVATAANSLLGLGARPDTLAHEIGHDLALDHTTFDAGSANNLLTAGNARTLPTTPANAISQLNAGTADQLNSAQQAQVLLSGFANPIPNVNTPVTDPVTNNDFNVSFTNAGRSGESLKNLILTAPGGVLFDPLSYDSLNLPGDTAGISVTPTFSDCSYFYELGSRCGVLTLAFTGSPFVLGDQFDYTVQFCLAGDGWCSPDSSVLDLAGGTYTYQFSDGFQTTSSLQPVGDPMVDANSWTPEATIPSQIYDEALLLAADRGQPPCTPVAGSCPPLMLADGSPIEEGTSSIPEPPSILILLSALAALPVARRLSSRARSHSNPALRRPTTM